MLDVWECDYKTDDQEAFLKTFWASQSCDVFIDEAGDMIGHYDRTMIQTATKGRHWGHNVHYMTQRPTMISPSVRTQCRILFLFVVGKKDAQQLAEEYNKPEIADAYNLPPGVCYVVKRHQPVTKLDVFDRSKNDEPTTPIDDRSGSGSDSPDTDIGRQATGAAEESHEESREEESEKEGETSADSD